MATNASRFKMSQERLDALKEELYYLGAVRMFRFIRAGMALNRHPTEWDHPE